MRSGMQGADFPGSLVGSPGHIIDSMRSIDGFDFQIFCWSFLFIRRSKNFIRGNSAVFVAFCGFACATIGSLQICVYFFLWMKKFLFLFECVDKNL